WGAVAMIVFGWGGAKPKDKGGVAPVQCPHCNNRVLLRYVHATSWFSLFWIPLIPYNPQHMLLCPICTQGIKVTKAQLAAVETMIQSTSAWQGGALPDG